jgi:hypothetical protein
MFGGRFDYCKRCGQFNNHLNANGPLTSDTHGRLCHAAPFDHFGQTDVARVQRRMLLQPKVVGAFYSFVILPDPYSLTPDTRATCRVCPRMQSADTVVHLNKYDLIKMSDPPRYLPQIIHTFPVVVRQRGHTILANCCQFRIAI